MFSNLPAKHKHRVSSIEHRLSAVASAKAEASSIENRLSTVASAKAEASSIEHRASSIENRVSSTQNKPNFESTQMNVSSVKTMNYEQITMNSKFKNKPNQSQFPIILVFLNWLYIISFSVMVT